MMVLIGTVSATSEDTGWSLNNPNPPKERKFAKFVRFTDGKGNQLTFPNLPAVLMGLQSIDADKGQNVRVSVEPQPGSITKEGFNAEFRTWADSVTYGLGASLIAIAF